jgi:superfamily II DNA or RNA helicase
MSLEPLQAAIAALASRCDFAQEQDGAGFNKSDTGIGHRLAALPTELWTADEARDAYDRIRKYAKQLESYGVDYRAIPKPELPDERPINWTRRVGLVRAATAKGATLSAADKAHEEKLATERRQADEVAGRRVTLEGGSFRVAFPYRPDLVAAVKCIPGRKRFDGATKTWLLDAGSLDVVRFRDVLERNRFTVDAEAEIKIDELYRGRVDGGESAAAPSPARLVDLSEDGSVLFVVFDYDAALVQKLKTSAPAARWSKTEGRWHVALRFGSVEGLSTFAAGHGFTVTPRALEAIERVCTEHRGRIDESRQASADLTPEQEAMLHPGLRPFPFQVAGINYALKAKRVIIGDEMGLGKTIQALVTAIFAGAFPIVVICPASLLYNWYKEARKWLPKKRTISILRSGTPGAYCADVLIINYDILTERRKPGEPKPKKVKGQKKAPVNLSRHARAIVEAKPRTIILDEFHYCKNYAAQRTEAVETIAKGVEYRLGLTGTLFLNRPQEAIAPLKILGRLEDVGGFWFYARRYCNAQTTGFGMDLTGASNLQELNEKLRAVCYIRREKSDVLTELPEKARQTIELDIDNRTEYNRAEENLREWIANAARGDVAFLEKLEKGMDELRRTLRLEGLDAITIDQRIGIERELAIDRYEDQKVESATRAETLVKMEALKQIAARGKLSAVKEWTGSFVEEQKLILFARHIAIQKALVAEFPGCAHLLGEDSPEARQAAVDRFQNDPDCRLIVCSLDAAGVGWTGTAASNVAFVEFGWTPAIHDQAEDRAHRIGQRDAVTAWYLVAKDTIEEDVVDLIEAKREVVTAATVGGVTVKRGSILAQTIGRLAKRRDRTYDDGPVADAADVPMVF